MPDKENNIIFHNDSDGKVNVNDSFAEEDVCQTQVKLVEIYLSSKSSVNIVNSKTNSNKPR